jgi:hypothetical protein
VGVLWISSRCDGKLGSEHNPLEILGISKGWVGSDICEREMVAGKYLAESLVGRQTKYQHAP